MQDIRQSSHYANYLSSIGWEVKKFKNTYFYIKRFLFITFIKLQRPEVVRYKDIKKLTTKFKGLVQVVIEPKIMKHAESSMQYGLKQTQPFLPSKTLILDLKKTKKEIFSSFSKDSRYSINKFKNYKLKIKNCTDLSVFYKAWRSSVPFGRYVLSSEELTKLKKAFGSDALFLLSEDKNSGAIFLVANNTGYYWQGFTSDKARKTLIQYSIVWEGIKWCKSKGAKYFDFEGIYDERFPLKQWKGFTQFKKKFGGAELEFPAAYQKWFIGKII